MAPTTQSKEQTHPVFTMPIPEMTLEVEGKALVAIPVELWERICEDLEDYADAQRAKAIMADASDPLEPLEVGRKELFDNHIKKVRKRKGMTQVQLSKKLRISQGRVSEIERADYRPTMKTYRRVAKALGCEIEELI